MTDAEWAALSPYLARRLGRPPRNLRATWDAIFWVACSTAPWAALPPGLGNPARPSALIYAARSGTLDQLLLAVSPHPFAPEGMASLEYRIVRAVRRASRQLRPETLMLARDLGLESALYCAPSELPAAEPPGAPASRAVPPRQHRPPRLPPIPRRVLRGLPPPRGFAPKLPAAPVPAGPAPRRQPAPARAARSPAICPKPARRSAHGAKAPRRGAVAAPALPVPRRTARLKC